MEPIEEIRKAIAAPPSNPAPATPQRHGTLIEPIANFRTPVPAAKTPPEGVPHQAHPASTIAPVGRRGVPVGESPVSANVSPTPVSVPQTPAAKSPPGRARNSADTHVETVVQPANVVAFRPTNRPPMAVIVAVDDGERSTGETWRIRQSPFVIGRNTGDVIIPHDSEMSGHHCEISRRLEEGRYHWYLTDQESTNGTFLKAAKIPLREGLQILIGSRRYEYRSGSAPEASAAATAPDSPVGTSRWQVPDVTLLERNLPSLTELTPEGDGRRYPLPSVDATLGSSSACGIQILNDPCVSPIHARIATDDAGRRFIENVNALNGLWVRIQEQRVDQDFEFQCGEQRFLVRFP